MSIRKPTVKERILLHLFDYVRFAEEYEAPASVTQQGIARAAGIEVRHVPQYLRPLIGEGMIAGSTKHVAGRPRRGKVYFLTEKGRQEAANQRGALLKGTVPFKTTDGKVREVPLSRVYQEHRHGASLAELVGELVTAGAVSEARPGTPAAPIDWTQEVPHVERFYGRDEDLASVLRALESSPVVVVTGIAGIGKSTLGAKVCEALRGRRALYWRQIRPWDTALALTSRIGGFLRALGRTSLASALSGGRPPELGSIEDLLASDLSGLDPVFVFDDVQTASDDVLAVLAVLAVLLRTLRGAKRPTMLLLSRAVPKFYSRRDVDVDRSVEEFRLGGLPLASRLALLEDAGVSDPVRPALAHASGGSPLFLKLLASSGGRANPEKRWTTIATYIAEEIEPGLADPERSCLQVASFYEIPVPASGLHLEEPADARAVIALHRRGLLEDELSSKTRILDYLWAGQAVRGERFMLHEALRDYFRTGMSEERRRDLTSKVVPWLLDGATDASQRKDRHEAIAYVSNAVRIDPDRKRRLSSRTRLGGLRISLGDFGGAVDAYRGAFGDAVEPDEVASVRHELAVALQELGRFEDADREIAEALALLPPGPSLSGAWLLYWRASGAWMRNEFGTASRVLDEAETWLSSLPPGDPPPQPSNFGSIQKLRGRTRELRGRLRIDDPERIERIDTARAREDFEAAIVDFESARDMNCLCRAYSSLALANIELGRPDEALANLERSAELAETMASAPARLRAIRLKAWFLLECRGDTDAAEALYRESFRLAKDAGQHVALVTHYADFAILYQRQGRYAEARESLDYYLGLTARGDLYNPRDRVEDLSLMVRLCVLDGDLGAAKKYLDQALSVSADAPSDTSDYMVTWAGGTLHSALGDVKSAADAFARAYEHAPPSHGGLALGEFLLAYGRFLAADGEAGKATAILREAMEESARTSRGPLERAAREALEAVVRRSPG